MHGNDWCHDREGGGLIARKDGLMGVSDDQLLAMHLYFLDENVVKRYECVLLVTRSLDKLFCFRRRFEVEFR